GRTHGRGRVRIRRPPSGLVGHRRRHPGVGARPHGQLQGAGDGRDRDGAAAQRGRQGAQVRAPRPCGRGRREGVKVSQAMIGLPVDGYVALGRAAEEAGFGSVALSDHVVYPEKLESTYPYTPDGRPQYDPSWDFPDPWVTVGAMATATTHLEFFTNVFVLP